MGVFMNNDYIKGIVPIVTMLVITGLASQVYDLYENVRKLEDDLVRREAYLITIEGLEETKKEHSRRVRILEDNWLKYKSECE